MSVTEENWRITKGECLVDMHKVATDLNSKLNQVKNQINFFSSWK